MDRIAVVGIGRSYRRGVLTWLHVRRVHTLIAHEEYTVLAEHGLTPAQFDVLSHVMSAPGLSQKELAQRLLVTKGNVCGLIDRLEKGSLVERRRDPDDRRTYQLYATAAGAVAFDAAAPVLEEAIAEQMSELNEDEQATLLALLGRLDRTLRE